MKINKKMFGILLLIPSAILLFLELKPIDLYEDPVMNQMVQDYVRKYMGIRLQDYIKNTKNQLKI